MIGKKTLIPRLSAVLGGKAVCEWGQKNFEFVVNNMSKKNIKNIIRNSIKIWVFRLYSGNQTKEIYYRHERANNTG
jgi:hypothetical protein